MRRDDGVDGPLERGTSVASSARPLRLVAGSANAAGERLGLVACCGPRVRPSAPRCARPQAMASPMPPYPPGSSATLPVRSNSDASSRSKSTVGRDACRASRAIGGDRRLCRRFAFIPASAHRDSAPPGDRRTGSCMFGAAVDSAVRDEQKALADLLQDRDVDIARSDAGR